MNKKITSAFVAVSVVAGLLMASAVYASGPSFSAFYTGNGDYVQVNISNGTPNSSVLLDTSTSIQSLGTSDGNGNFTATISTSAYNIAPGSIVYVTVDGAQSSPIQWPYTSSSSGSNTSFSLNETSVSVAVGQSVIITASNDGPFYLSSNSDPSVANVSFNGESITLQGNTIGSTNLDICLVDSSSSCEGVTVNVASANSGGALSFNQNNLDLPLGGLASVDVSGGTGSYEITNDSNPSALAVSITGAVVSLDATNVAGTATVTVCSSDMSSCNVINVTVGQGGSSSGLVFSNTAPSVALNQSSNVSIIGGVAPYYLSSNTNSSVVSVSISGNIVTLSGSAQGSADVTVCSNNSVCGSLPVTVGSTSSGNLQFTESDITVAAGESTSDAILNGASFYISSQSNSSVASAQISGDDVNVTGLEAGTDTIGVCASNTGGCGTLYVTVTGASGTVTSPSSALTLTQVVSVGQAENILLSGATAPYTISSALSPDFSAAISSGEVLTVTGVSEGQSSITVCSANGVCSPVYVDVVAAAVPSSGSGTSASQYDFTTLLTYGSTGTAVTALQEQLTRDAIYSGPITGYYGDLTVAAVKTFQSRHGISAVGYTGPSTRAALNAGE